VPEPFSRAGQRGGLVAGELLLGAGVAFLLAGAATFLAPGARSLRRLWVLACAACVWAVVVLPAVVYPPLPPGVESELPVRERQQLYIAVVGVGLAAFGFGVRIWGSGHRFRLPLALAAVAVPAGLAIVLFPENETAAGELPPGLLTDFRVVSIGGQLLFWAALGVAGALLLRRRARAEGHAPAPRGEQERTAA
jgi:predicted cobalt transporter CbtA